MFCRYSELTMLSYCGLVDTKIRASDKDLPVTTYLRQEIKNKVSGILRYRSRMVKFCLKLSIKFHVLI